jgi:hypothetical protein
MDDQARHHNTTHERDEASRRTDVTRPSRARPNAQTSASLFPEETTRAATSSRPQPRSSGAQGHNRLASKQPPRHSARPPLRPSRAHGPTTYDRNPDITRGRPRPCRGNVGSRCGQGPRMRSWSPRLCRTNHGCCVPPNGLRERGLELAQAPFCPRLQCGRRAPAPARWPSLPAAADGLARASTAGWSPAGGAGMAARPSSAAIAGCPSCGRIRRRAEVRAALAKGSESHARVYVYAKSNKPHTGGQRPCTSKRRTSITGQTRTSTPTQHTTKRDEANR